jgi:hypothetical protein
MVAYCPAEAWAPDGRQLSSIAPESPGPHSGPAPGVNSAGTARGLSSDLEAFGGASEGSLTGGAGKKKKGFFGKISKGIKTIADGFKRKPSVRALQTPDGWAGSRNSSLAVART